MRKIFTPFFTLVLLLVANFAFAQNPKVWVELTNVGTDVSGDANSITIRIVHEQTGSQTFKMALQNVINGSTITVPSSVAYAYDISNDVDGSSNPIGFVGVLPTDNSAAVPNGEYIDYKIDFDPVTFNSSTIFLFRVDNTTNATWELYALSVNSSLPVELVRFDANAKGSELALNWATASEKNSSHFEIERSFDGSEFAQLGTVKANGNSASMNNYSFRASNAGGVSYFRLKMVDLDGAFEYSKIIAVKSAEVKKVAIRINNAAVATEMGADEEISRVVITGLNGQVIYDNALAGICQTTF